MYSKWSKLLQVQVENVVCWFELQARLAQIDLFSELGGVREASVQRYKEKRRNRLFSKKIRYQVRKLNADRRPRMKVLFLISSFTISLSLLYYQKQKYKICVNLFVWLTKLGMGVSAQPSVFLLIAFDFLLLRRV